MMLTIWGVMSDVKFFFSKIMLLELFFVMFNLKALDEENIVILNNEAK